MEVLFIMIPFTFLLSGGALIACIWAIKKGQYDDIETPPLRILNEIPLENNKDLNKIELVTSRYREIGVPKLEKDEASDA